MSELLDPPVEDLATIIEPASPPSAGALLRSAREAAGLHIAALAVSLKVPVKKLEALESDRLDLLPDAVFVRGLASSVCRSLKIDSAPVLSQLPQTIVPRLASEESGLNMPFRAPGDAARVSMGEQISRPGLLVALVFVVGALVLVFLPSLDSTDKDASAKTASEVVVSVPLTQPAVAEPVAAAAGPSADAVVPNPQPATGIVSVPASNAPAAANPSAVQPVAAAAAGVMPAPQADTLAASGLLVFKARGQSWVEVTDAQRVVQLRRILASGETVGVAGALPLSVVVGRADTINVLVRGKPLSLDAVTRENVARFEVK